MSTTGVDLSQKVVPLDDSRSTSPQPKALSTRSFEEDLAAAERRLAGEVVPFPNSPPSLFPLPTCPAWEEPFHDLGDSDLEVFFDHVEERIKALEHDILSLARQVSALLRCL